MPDLFLPFNNGNDDLYSEIIRENLNNRILIFNDEVNDSLIENYILYILKWNREDKDIDPAKRRRITLILNSPGGDCMIGFGGMVNCIEQSKTPIVACIFRHEGFHPKGYTSPSCQDCSRLLSLSNRLSS